MIKIKLPNPLNSLTVAVLNYELEDLGQLTIPDYTDPQLGPFKMAPFIGFSLVRFKYGLTPGTEIAIPENTDLESGLKQHWALC